MNFWAAGIVEYHYSHVITLKEPFAGFPSPPRNSSQWCVRETSYRYAMASHHMSSPDHAISTKPSLSHSAPQYHDNTFILPLEFRDLSQHLTISQTLSLDARTAS